MKGAISYSGAHFGVGSGDIFLDDVTCTESEAELLSCSSSPIGTHNCQHSGDAGVACAGGVSLMSQPIALTDVTRNSFFPINSSELLLW